MKTVQILVVDDQAIIAEDLIMKMNQMGYSGYAVSSGKEAIKKISTNFAPDLILMDVNLNGDKNGIQIARIIQKSRKIPVIFVTAYSTPSVLNDIRDLVLTDCIQKPVDRQQLQVAIRRLLAAA